MSTDDIQRRLGAEPQRLRTPSAPPVEAVIDRARTARARRRSTFTAAVAALAAAAAATPILATGAPWRDHPGGRSATISVNAPHLDAHGGTVFSGVDDGKKWSVSVPAGTCASRQGEINACGPGPDAQHGSPADIGSTVFTASPVTYWVHLRPDVAHLTVELTDAEQLTLVPATIGNTPAAMFELTRRVGITRITAYAPDGSMIAYSIPYQGPADAKIAMWYRPGETPTQPQAAGTITSTIHGAVNKLYKGGPSVTVQVNTGPFGICYTTRQLSGDQQPVPVTSCRPLPTSRPITTTTDDGIPSDGLWWVALGGLVDNSVDHVDFNLSTGTFRVPATRIGGFTFAVGIVGTGGSGFTNISRTAYDAAGHVLTTTPQPTK